ncbi:ABC transporter permease [Sinomicrobium weinanense]|uniref:ABC transporter permease n=1 Tax=Sinomicrobium weinanense TaxID=2842200 RepID=A0A926JNW4_9FLAO|nr:ABC transporter permease [Sinomicrobium weinanense]MBC9794762.1 ABC transporter permease [Sinomicrobium weinanense]MBU3125021.1 ABC transporter permease [Sinomicrobium weinanense]
MIRNYFKIAWRNLWKNKGYSLLNIGGLAVGMAAAMLILLMVQNERSMDMFHHKKDRLYIAGNQSVFDGKIDTWFWTPKPLGPALSEEYPEVGHTARYASGGRFLFSNGDRKINTSGAFIDPDFLNMFDFPLLEGDKKHLFDNPSNMVITAATAKKIFGKERQVVGKTIKIDSTDYATVTGVLDDLPGNTQFEFEYLLPWSYMKKLGWADESWGNNSVSTFVELRPNADRALVEDKIRDITKRRSNGQEDNSIILHSIPDWWLRSKFENGKIAGGRIEMVRMFTFIACFILLIACINFMNLSTARSEKRAREVGVRKVAGAGRYSLIGQFLGESILIASVAGIVSLGIVLLAIPYFNSLVNHPLSIDLGNSQFWLLTIGVILITGLLAGSYPAFFLSSFKPVKTLKGTFRQTHSGFNPRKALVVVQFTIAIILIVSTLVIHRQIQFGKDREDGYDKNNLVYIMEQGDIPKNTELIKSELLHNNIAASVTRTFSPLTEGWSNTWGIEWRGKQEGDKTTFDRFSADEHLVQTAGLTLVTGRDFDLAKYPTDSTAVLLSESAVKAMGFDNPIGEIIRDNDTDMHVVGVVKDFIMRSPYEPIPPMLIEGFAVFGFNTIHIKFNPSLSTAEALAKTEEIFKKYNPAYPFVYHFVDEAYAQKFRESQRTGTLAALFAFLTIFISCLGLFGLAAYMAENRTKEIGVRKVLGASVFSITKLLSREFVMLVLASCIIAFPIAYWLMDRFLQNFNYRISLGWGIFIVAGAGALILALLTVSSQAIKAAVANPAKSLKTE